MINHGMPPNLTETMQGAVTEALEQQSRIASAAREQGDACSGRGDHAGALGHYERAVEAEPNVLERARTYETIGRLHLTLGKPGAAQEVLSQAEFYLAILPGGKEWDWHPSSIAFGYAFDQEDTDPDAAEAAYQVVLRMGHARFTSRAEYNLGMMRLRRFRLAEAISLFESSLTHGNREDKGYAAYALANCWEVRGNRWKAAGYYWTAFHTRDWRSPQGWRKSLGAIRRLLSSREGRRTGA